MVSTALESILGTPASSNSSKTCLFNGDTKLALGVNVMDWEHVQCALPFYETWDRLQPYVTSQVEDGYLDCDIPLSEKHEYCNIASRD